MLQQTLLFSLFMELREAGVRLELDHLKLMLSAIAAGSGYDETGFVRLCRILWLSTDQEQRVFDQAFGHIRQRFGVSAVSQQPLAAPPANDDTSSVPSATTPALFDNTSSRSAEGVSDTTLPDKRMWRAVGIDEVENLRSVSVSLSARDFLPVSRRQMKQSLRYLRRMERRGTVTEIDIRRTLAKVAEEGIFAEPVLIPRRSNSAEVLLFIDVDGSMVPFHALTRRLVEVVSDTGLFRRVACFYFHDVPGPRRIYTDPSRRTFTSLADALGHVSRHAFAFVISDAGAARASLDERRVRATSEFLSWMSKAGHRTVWLNPMPVDRWSENSAAPIAKLVPMYELSRRGLDLAVAALRGLRERPAARERSAQFPL
jgi:uncharacterized protein with von Willebrand factor type A (vWA) domain